MRFEKNTSALWLAFRKIRAKVPRLEIKLNANAALNINLIPLVKWDFDNNFQA
jgi:hypothetical protein